MTLRAAALVLDRERMLTRLTCPELHDVRDSGNTKFCAGQWHRGDRAHAMATLDLRGVGTVVQ